MPTYSVLTGQCVPSNPELYGGKGNGLLSMANAGLPVPPALILTTEAWNYYRKTGHLHPITEANIVDMIDAYPDSMFSVRSGAPVSMPGMMDTVLNVGVTDELDAEYPGAARRYITSWLGIVHGVSKPRIDELVKLVNARSQGDPAKFRKLITGVVQASENVAIPQGRFDQVAACVRAVFDSWDTPRAKAYREMHGIPDDMGTACVIQKMVMGTASGFSGSGVMFSRDPATGEPKVRGEIALNAQGEEVVSGEVTPTDLDDLFYTHKDKHSELCLLAMKLEKAYGDVQDVEFTYEKDTLYVLQTRTAKMSARARIVTACALAKNNFPDEPVQQLAYLKQRVSKAMVAKTRVPVVNTQSAPVTTGLAASPGAICGKVVFRTTPLSQVDKDCILVAEDTAPEDFPIMAKCGAIWTAKGGFTCHSAVVARGIGVPAVVGCEGLEYSDAVKGGSFKVGKALLAAGDTVTLDGTTGEVWIGKHDVEAASPPREVYNLLHELVASNGLDVPADTYYLDCGLGQRVVLPLDPEDAPALERQLARADRMLTEGKTVAVAFDFQGLGEDMFAPPLTAIFEKLAEDYGPDLSGMAILYGVPSDLHAFVKGKLGCEMNTEKVAVLDLLDLLED
jgi:pyruvate,orthophosphate dikinase